MYIAYLILLGFAIISNSTLILILFRYRQRVTTVVSLIIFLLLINIWIIPLFLTNAFHIQGEFFETLRRFSALGYIFTPVAFLVFILSYTLNTKLLQSYTLWLFLLLPATIFLYLSWSSNLISIHDYHKAILFPWGYETPIGPYFYLYFLWFAMIVIFALIPLWQNYTMTKEGIKKRQARYILVAIIISFVIGSITNGILLLLNIYIVPAGALTASITSIIVVLAIMKYGLFEITPLTILSGINHAIITVDNKGNILHMNTYSERMLGVKMPQVTSKALDQYLFVNQNGKRKTNQLDSLLQQVFHKKKSISSDIYVVMNKKKHVFPYTTSITPLFLQQKVIGANIFLRDTTREKEREKYKDDFLNILSHELRTPITSSKAYNQILLKLLKDPHDKKRQLVQKIDEQLDRILRLTTDYFELSRVQTGKMKLKKEFIHISELVHDVVETLAVTYKTRTIKIQGNTNAVCMIDKDRITQVITNLVTNAIKFSPDDKEITILIKDSGKNVIIGVRDYGKGIPPEFHKKIFNQFYQIENVLLANTGLGIGLYISSYIIKMHGGKIWVDSTPGKGSTFYFSLPVSN